MLRDCKRPLFPIPSSSFVSRTKERKHQVNRLSSPPSPCSRFIKTSRTLARLYPCTYYAYAPTPSREILRSPSIENQCCFPSFASSFAHRYRRVRNVTHRWESGLYLVIVPKMKDRALEGSGSFVRCEGRGRLGGTMGQGCRIASALTHSAVSTERTNAQYFTNKSSVPFSLIRLSI